jgi:hypothetical protein
MTVQRFTHGEVAEAFARKAELRRELASEERRLVEARLRLEGRRELLALAEMADEVVAGMPISVTARRGDSYEVRCVLPPYRIARAYKSVRAGEGWHVEMTDHERFTSGNGHRWCRLGTSEGSAIAAARAFAIHALVPADGAGA